jgi:hypothetical protein
MVGFFVRRIALGGGLFFSLWCEGWNIRGEFRWRNLTKVILVSINRKEWNLLFG